MSIQKIEQINHTSTAKTQCASVTGKKEDYSLLFITNHTLFYKSQLGCGGTTWRVCVVDSYAAREKERLQCLQLDLILTVKCHTNMGISFARKKKKDSPVVDDSTKM